MARITVEDCILKVPNRFELVMVAAQRARDVSAGAPLNVDRDNDKNPVVALREIAEEAVDTETLRQSLIQGLQKHVEQDVPEDEDPDLLAVGEGLGAPGPQDQAAKDKSLIEEEIAEDVLTVGEEAIESGAEIEDSAESAESDDRAGAENEDED